MRNLLDLRGKNIVVYDIETENLVGEMVDGREVTWGTHDLMGISCACLFDYESGDNMVYMADNLWKLTARLNAAHLVVGFNHKNFDNRVLRASGQLLMGDDLLPNYDLWEVAMKGQGYKDGQRRKGNKLDDFLEHTFSAKLKKTGDGALAPELFKQKKYGELISYCQADVRRTRMLFEYAWMYGAVKNASGSVDMADPGPFFKKVATNEPKGVVNG